MIARRLAWLPLIVLVSAGCPGGPPPAAVAAAPADLDLDNTRWWLRVSDGKPDERLIEVKRAGSEYLCTLVNPGRILSHLKYKAGEVYCKLQKTGPAQYEGTYYVRFIDGTTRWRPVTFTATPGALRWSEGEGDRWERLP